MRNIPLILLGLVMVVMMVGVLRMPASAPQVTIVPEPEPVNQKAFTGRMVMPSINDIYVLENSAGRDIEQVEKFLQGRAAGLHWLAADYFRNVRKAAKKSFRKTDKKSMNGNLLQPSISDGDVMMGVKLTLDSLGLFHPEVIFSNVDDEDLKTLVVEHIQTYWRFRRGTSGKFEMWAPFVWKNVWNPKAPQE